MVSTYHGVETGRRALTYFRKGMEMAGTNTMNATTEGYSRQKVNAATTSALSTVPNMSHLGTGIEIVSIERMRDQFLDARYRRSEIANTYLETIGNGIVRVDKIMVNASNKGINNYLNDFWTSLQTLHTKPGELAIQQNFYSSAEGLVDFAAHLYKGYNDYRDELNQDVKTLVEEANSLIDQIAIISKSIQMVRMAGGEPNQLLDKRDLLADRLCLLTGAETSTSIDEQDGDFKVNLNGKLLVQGTNTRHLVLVENPANKGYYEVQIEANQYDITSNSSVAEVIIERRADDMRLYSDSCTKDGTHGLEVLRLADEMNWTVGGGSGRRPGITDPEDSLSINGSFSLQVGTSGVRAYSEAFLANPPGVGVVRGEPAPGQPEAYSFRIAAGDFETTIDMEWDATNQVWLVNDNRGNAMQSAAAGLTVQELSTFISATCADHGVIAKSVDNALVLESTERQQLSITDISGDLMTKSGLTNGNPIVRIDVEEGDSLQTIANKINNAYLFDRTVEEPTDEDGDGDEDEEGEKKTAPPELKYATIPADTAPSRPEEWMHASVEKDADGNYFLCLTSNVAGEAHRINVMSGSVCGGEFNDLSVARELGLVETTASGQAGVTSHIQIDRETGAVIGRDDGDVYVDDAWVRYDGKEYLSATNEFKEARKVSEVGNATVDRLEEMAAGIRFSLNGTGDTTITVRHPLLDGQIFATIKLRDDILLANMDMFDDMLYKLSMEFNAVHYSGYGTGEVYGNVTGMAFFSSIAGQYGAFGKFALDKDLIFERIASATGDGHGKSLSGDEGADGTNALSLARLQQEKLFLDGTATIEDLYKKFVADVGALADQTKNALAAQGHVSEQIEIQRQQVMGVNADEEMMDIVNMNQNFNYTSQYLSTIMQLIDQIISGVGRVGL